MALNVTAINDIADTIIAFVPIILLISVVSWVVGAFTKAL